jgi:hypothetical protein
MARGHRRTKTTWRTRPSYAKNNGGWEGKDTRERKPKKKQKQPKRRPNEPQKSAWFWWWIIARGGECHGCGAPIPKGHDCAYRSIDQALRCRVCVEHRGLTPRESKGYREAKAA